MELRWTKCWVFGWVFGAAAEHRRAPPLGLGEFRNAPEIERGRRHQEQPIQVR